MTVELTPTSYISHHLASRTVSFGDSPFWTLHVDALITSVVLGVIAFGFLWLVTRGATAGVPGRRQAFVKLAVGFVDDQVKGIFHGNRNFITPLAPTTAVAQLAASPGCASAAKKVHGSIPAVHG